MPLILFGHPFSSYTQKVIVALYENGLEFELRPLTPDHPDNLCDWSSRWPLRQFPVLIDGERQLVETSIIIEYLQLSRTLPVPLLPAAPERALHVRFLDRFFDLHVMNVVQHAVSAALAGDAERAREARGRATDKLNAAYDWLERHLEGDSWAAGSEFSLADCAAAPALFYADWTEPMASSHARLRRYRSRLLARPSFARAVEEARSYRSLFPLGAPDRD